MRGTISDIETSLSCTYRSEYPETEIHPLVCLVKTENGQRHWREREDPPVQSICMNAASKVGSGSDRPKSRSWPICLAMTAPALVLLSGKGSSERSSEGWNSRDVRPGTVSVSALDGFLLSVPGEVVSGIQASISIIKFQKEPPCRFA